MQGPVELSVAAAVESVPDGVAAAGGDGGDAGEGGECGLAADPAGVGPGDEELGGGDHADAGQVEQFGAGGHDELLEVGFVLGGFGLEEQGTAGGGADRRDGGAVLDAVAGQGAEPGAAVELLVGGAAAQLVAQRCGRVHDQRLELADGFGAADDGAVSGGEQDAQGFAVAAGPGCGQMLAGQRFAGGADGVEFVGLGAVTAGRAGGPVDLDDPFAVLEQEGGEPGAEAAGALDRPDPPAGGVQDGEGQDPFVAHRVGGAVQVVDDTAGGGFDDGGDVGVAVGVDADDEVDLA